MKLDTEDEEEDVFFLSIMLLLCRRGAFAAGRFLTAL